MRNWHMDPRRISRGLRTTLHTPSWTLTRVLPLAALWAAGLFVAQEGLAQPATVLPGDERIRGEALWEYESSWQSRVHNGTEWADQAVVTEHLWQEGDRWIRTQVTDLGAWGTEVRIEMDRRTLRPLSLKRTILEKTPEAVLSQLAQAGFAKEFEMTFEQSSYVLRSTPFEGEATTTNQDVGTPFYDGSALGLIVAALPLEEGTQARLPIVFVDGRNGSVTKYWVDAAVAARQAVAGQPAVRVDVAWADLDTGEVTSEAGPDAPGGAYWIDVSGSRDAPVVPRYKNDTFDIVVTR